MVVRKKRCFNVAQKKEKPDYKFQVIDTKKEKI